MSKNQIPLTASDSKTLFLLSDLMQKVYSLYRRYGASRKDVLQRDRLNFIQHNFAKELNSRPELVDELTGSNAAQRHFIMQMLLEMVSEQARTVNTPVGKIVAYPKHSGPDEASDYPGVFIDLQREGKDDLMLACVEYLPEGDLQCCVYSNGADDTPHPDPIIYENLDAE